MRGSRGHAGQGPPHRFHRVCIASCLLRLRSFLEKRRTILLYSRSATRPRSWCVRVSQTHSDSENLVHFFPFVTDAPASFMTPPSVIITPPCCSSTCSFDHRKCKRCSLQWLALRLPLLSQALHAVVPWQLSIHTASDSSSSPSMRRLG